MSLREEQQMYRYGDKKTRYRNHTANTGLFDSLQALHIRADVTITDTSAIVRGKYTYTFEREHTIFSEYKVTYGNQIAYIHISKMCALVENIEETPERFAAYVDLKRACSYLNEQAHGEIKSNDYKTRITYYGLYDEFPRIKEYTHENSGTIGALVDTGYNKDIVFEED